MITKQKTEPSSPKTTNPTKSRIAILDEIRGLAITAMVLYHILYSAGEVFGYRQAHNIFRSVMPFEPLIPITFIFISGICTRLSRSNLKRGSILFAVALLINIVTYIIVPDIVIRFGVINLLSVSMIVYGLTEKAAEKAKPAFALVISLFLFVFTWGIPKHFIGIFDIKLFVIPEVLYKTDFLFPLGLKNDSFYSSDYFPVFPWIFLFYAGSFFHAVMTKKGLPDSVFKTHSKPLGFIGKHAIIIYMIHQPLIFGILTVIGYFYKQ